MPIRSRFSVPLRGALVAMLLIALLGLGGPYLVLVENRTDRPATWVVFPSGVDYFAHPTPRALEPGQANWSAVFRRWTKQELWIETADSVYCQSVFFGQGWALYVHVVLDRAHRCSTLLFGVEMSERTR